MVSERHPSDEAQKRRTYLVVLVHPAKEGVGKKGGEEEEVSKMKGQAVERLPPAGRRRARPRALLYFSRRQLELAGDRRRP